MAVPPVWAKRVREIDVIDNAKWNLGRTGYLKA